MNTITVGIGTLVTRAPDIRGGRPRIAGTGVTVQRIVGWYKLGFNPEEIADQIDHLSYAQVYAALPIIMPTAQRSKRPSPQTKLPATRLRRGGIGHVRLLHEHSSLLR